VTRANLLSGTATVTGTGTLDTEFNLSHVCSGSTTTTSTAPPTTTTQVVEVATSTTTLAVLGGNLEQNPSSGSLAFTGIGRFGAALFVLGIIAMILGIVLVQMGGRPDDAMREV
jgi:hypothetical protein